MRDLRLQFFLTLGMLGTVMPYVAVFFRERGLSERQVGYAYAIWSLAALLSPAVMTMVADAKVDSRRVLMLMSALVGASLFAMTWVPGTGNVIAVWTLWCVSSTAIFPLQDGVHFSQQRRNAKAGRAAMPYHKVRVWGTIGFITPSLVLYYFLKEGRGLWIVLTTGAAFAAMAAIQANLLQDPRPNDPDDVATDAAVDDAPRIPTFAAVRVLFSPGMPVFCAAIMLVQMAFSIHSAFYPIYLTENVGLQKQWLGIASNLAVFIEILLTFGCGWLLLKLGVKRLLMLGMLLMALRMGLIASSKSPWIAVGTQVFHGFLILAISVVPHTILDSRAGDRFRHSMQALFVVLVSCGNAFASFWAGRLAGYGLYVLFGIGAALCAAAAGMVLFLWTDDAPAPSRGFEVITEPAEALVEPPVQPI